MNEFSLVALAALWACCLIGWICVVLLAVRVQALRAMRVEWPTSLVKSLQEQLTLTQDELQALANRVKMMKVRRATDHIREDDRRERGEPDPVKEPDAWRNWKNRQLAINGR